MTLRPEHWLPLCGDAQGRDCWALVAEVYRRRGTPLVGGSAEAFDDWRPVDAPEPGDAILTTTDGRAHVGVYVGDGKYVHATADGIVHASRVAALRRAGRPVAFYRHAGTVPIDSAPPTPGSVRVVYLPDPIGDPGRRDSWTREPGTIGALCPPGATAVALDGALRNVADVADIAAPDVAVYLRAPAGLDPITQSLLIGVGLSLLSAAITILTTPKPKTQTRDEASPTFDLDGIRNTARSGIPQPVVYGEHRVGGNIISSFQSIGADGRATLRSLYFLSRGPVQSVAGLTADADQLSGPDIPSAVEIDGNPASNYECRVSVRLGGSEQTTVPGFGETITAQPYQFAIDQPSPPVNWPNAQWFGHETSTAVTGFDLLINYPGGLVGTSTSNGNFYPLVMNYEVRYRVKGTTTYTTEVWTHSGQTNASTSRQFAKRGLTRDVYEVGLRWIGGTSPTNNVQGTSDTVYAATLIGVNEVVAEGFQYPGCALLGIEIVGTDQIGSSFPVVTTTIEGVHVYVWDGVSTTAPAFSKTYTRNPAWCMLDALINPDYGLGRGGRLTLDNVHLEDFDAWADLCDTLVDDGRGGTIPRARFDYVVDSAHSAWSFIRDAALASWARVYWAGNKVRVWLDTTETPSFVFGAGNTRDVKITKIGRRSRPNAVEVAYINSETGYEDDVAFKPDEAAVVTSGEPINKESLAGIGVTRAAQAYRLAQSLMLHNRLDVYAAEWVGGPDSLHIEPGAVVHLHTSAIGRGGSGRVLAAVSDEVTLDRAVTASARVRLVVTRQDDTTQTVYIDAGTYARGDSIPIVDSGGTPTTWTTTPTAGAKWVIGAMDSNSAPLAFRVESVRRDRTLTSYFTGRTYDATVYSDDPGDVEEFTDEIPDPREMPSSVTGLRVVGAVGVACDGSVTDAILVSFRTVNAWEAAEVWYRALPDGGYTSPDLIDGWIFAGWSRGDMRIPAACGTWEVAVRARSARGTMQRISDAARAAVFVRGRRTPPDAPQSVVATVSLGTLTVRTTPPADASTVAGYEVRYGSSWAGSALIARTATPDWSGPCPFVGTETVRVRSVSRTGVVSVTSATASVAHAVAESVYTTDVNANEHTSWGGTKTRTVVTGGELQIQSGQTSGTYLAPALPTAITKEQQEVRVRLRGNLANVAMTWDEAAFLWDSPLAESLTWDTAYLSGEEVTSLDSPTWDQAGFTWDGLQASLRTWDGPTDVLSALTPLVEYDVDQGSGYSGTYSDLGMGATFANLAGVRPRITLRRPHTRYDPRAVQMTTTTFALAESEPIRYSGQFYTAAAPNAGISIRGFSNSTNVNQSRRVPSGKKLVVLGVQAHCETGATAGTYTVEGGIYNLTDTTFISCASTTGAQNSDLWATGEGTRVAPLTTLAAGKEWLIAFRNGSGSPGALANTVHSVTLSWIYEDV